MALDYLRIRMTPTPQAATAIRRALNAPSSVAHRDPIFGNQMQMLQHCLFAYDQRSLFTGAPVADLQFAHIINPIHISQNEGRGW